MVPCPHFSHSRIRALWMAIFLAALLLACESSLAVPGSGWFDTYWEDDPASDGDWLTQSNWSGPSPSSTVAAEIWQGTANIRSGSAAAKSLNVYDEGRLAQSGGSASFGWLGVGYGGQYLYGAGTIQIQHGWDIYGGMDFAGKTLSLNMDNSLLTFRSSGQVRRAGWVSLSIGPNSLVCLDPGVNPATLFGSYTNTGLTHVIGTDLTVGPAQHFAGWGDIDDFVHCQGTISAPDGGFLSLWGGILISSGTADLGKGQLSCWDSRSAVTGGALSVDSAQIGGVFSLSGEGTANIRDLQLYGTIAQTGGSAIFGTLSNGYWGAYTYTSGTLTLQHGWDNAGTMDFTGKTLSLNMDNSLVFFRSSGSVRNADGVSLNVGPNSLVCVDPGVNPAALFGSYTNAGMTHIIGTEMVVGPTQHFAGWGEIDDFVHCQGVISAEDGGGISLWGGILVSSGTADLGKGELSAWSSGSGVTGGVLKVDALNLDDTFTQTAGAATFTTRLNIEYGTYLLQGGEMSFARLAVRGWGDDGKIRQTGGTAKGLDSSSEIYLGGDWDSGTYELSGNGALACSLQRVNGGGQFVQSGGSNQADRLFIDGNVNDGYDTPNSGTYTISAGSLNVGALEVGALVGSRPAAFCITDAAARITVSGALSLGEASRFEAVPGSAIHISGTALQNASASSSNLAGLLNLNLIVEGGANVLELEVAGRDVGPVAAGWTDNFVLGTLTLGDPESLATGGTGSGSIRLVNSSSNATGWWGAEALYVNNLVLNADASVDLNGLHLYYLANGTPHEFTNLLLSGDANLDDIVDQADYTVWYNHYGAAGGWTEGDFTGDDLVDQADYTVWYNNYGSTSGGSVPEPTTLSLLALGILATVRRERQV